MAREGRVDPTRTDLIIRLALLTEKEKEALRLVPGFGSVQAIADELGISFSAAKQRLNSAARKLGVTGRHAATRLLLSVEATSASPNQTVPKQRLGSAEADGIGSSDRAVPLPELREERVPYRPAIPSMLVWMRHFLVEPGARQDRTHQEKLRLIGWWALLCLIAFSLLAAVLSDLSRAVHDLSALNR